MREEQRMTIKNQMFLLKPSFLAKILLVSLLMANAVTSKDIGRANSDEETTIDDVGDLNSDKATTEMMYDDYGDESEEHQEHEEMAVEPEPTSTSPKVEATMGDVTEAPGVSTSTKRSKKPRTTKQRKEYTKKPKDRQRQRSTRRTPIFTGPFSLYKRTSSLSPIIYPTKASDTAEPAAEPHPLNINLSVYVYPNKEENKDSAEDDYHEEEEDNSEKRKIKEKKGKPVLVASEKVPVLPSGFEPLDINLEKVVIGKEVDNKAP